jgi:hypothetical protein
MFQFPTKYEDTGPAGDKLWDSLMPSMYFFFQATKIMGTVEND